jgi:hypothetical protein
VLRGVERTQPLSKLQKLLKHYLFHFGELFPQVGFIVTILNRAEKHPGMLGEMLGGRLPDV